MIEPRPEKREQLDLHQLLHGPHLLGSDCLRSAAPR